MRFIKLDAHSWKSESDFYDALLSALGSPEWHGRNVAALVDSMVCGGINSLEPPYSVHVVNADKLPGTVLEEVAAAGSAIHKVREDRRARTGIDVEVSLELLPKQTN